MPLTEADRADTSASGRPGSARAFFLRLHFYVGILVGPFLLVAAVTGGLYAVAPTIEGWMYRDQLQAQTAGPALPIAEQVRAAQHARPDLAAVAVRPGESGRTTQVLFADPTLEESRRAVFVDPASGDVQGELAVYGSSNALPLRAWLSGLHRNLNLGEPGRLYSELAASWLAVVVLGGLYLWVGRHLRARGRNRLLTVDRAATGRRRTLNWHGATGIWIAAGLLFLSATGLTWSAYAGANVDKLRAALSWSTPAVSTSLSGHGDADGADDPHTGHGHGITAPSMAAAPDTARVAALDRVLATARGAGLDGPVEIAVPADAATAFTVAQTRQPWVLSTNTVAVDGATGAVTDASWFADWPVAAKLAAWGIQLHMGTLFGLPNQLALLALACALVAVIVGGYRMWWQRRPTGGAALGRPPRRGALAALAPGVAVAVIAGAALIGWFVPLLGASLAGFVLVDVIVGAVRRGRALDSPALRH